MRREGRPGLLHRNTMTLLFSLTRLHPTLNIRCIARVVVEAPTGLIKDRPQHADITVDRPSGKVARAATTVKASLAKKGARKGVDLRAACLAPMMQKPEDVQRRGVSQRSAGSVRRRTDSTNGQKQFKVGPQAILLPGVLSVADI